MVSLAGTRTPHELPTSSLGKNQRWFDPGQTDTDETLKLGLRYRKHNNKLLCACNLSALSCLSPTGEPAVKTLLPATMCDFILVSQAMPRSTKKAVDERHKMVILICPLRLCGRTCSV